MKAFLNVILVAFLAVSVYGLGGGEPEWLRYVGWATVMLLLLLILQGVSNIPSMTEMRKMVGDSAMQAHWKDPDLDAPEAQGPAPRRSQRN